MIIIFNLNLMSSGELYPEISIMKDILKRIWLNYNNNHNNQLINKKNQPNIILKIIPLIHIKLY